MKMFTKLALVSSMAISANAMAMQAMDDAALSSATGQDGINIGVALGSNASLDASVGTKGISIDKLFLHDNGGLATQLLLTVKIWVARRHLVRSQLMVLMLVKLVV